jgi:hypothetical protein
LKITSTFLFLLIMIPLVTISSIHNITVFNNGWVKKTCPLCLSKGG